MPYIDIVFDRKVPDYDGNDRFALAMVFFEKEFEELAKRLGVAPLVKFYSDDPETLEDWFDEDYFDDPQELERLKEKEGPEEFFDPADGLKSVSALRAHLETSPMGIMKYEKNIDSRLLDELTEVEQSLSKAAACGAKFHFLVDPG